MAVGRIIADSQIKARELVDKIANYYDEKSMVSGETIAVSDDVDEDWKRYFRKQLMSLLPSDQLQTIHERGKDSHRCISSKSTSAGERYPKAKTDFFDRLDEGAVVINYFGHGGEDGLASERIFDKFDAQNLKH